MNKFNIIWTKQDANTWTSEMPGNGRMIPMIVTRERTKVCGTTVTIYGGCVDLQYGSYGCESLAEAQGYCESSYRLTILGLDPITPEVAA